MSRIPLSAFAYMTKISDFHSRFSFAFYTLPEEVNDENERKIQATHDLISDYADFFDGHLINKQLHPVSSDSDTTFTVIRILMAKINKYQRDILDKTKTYKNVNIIVLEQPSSY
jgi:hypothetical protein